MTGLLGNRRVPKDDARIEAYGTVDELNAMLGLVRANSLDSEADGLLAAVQGDLFVVGSALADPAPGGPFHNVITDEHVTRLESAIDTLETELSCTDPVHSARGYGRCRANPPRTDDLPPRRAIDRQVIAPAGGGRTGRDPRLLESLERLLVCPRPHCQPPGGRGRYSLERALKWRLERSGQWPRHQRARLC